MTTVIKASSPADFLAMVPALCGYQPKRSLLIVPFAGNRTIGVARYDQPRDERQLDGMLDIIRRIEGADAAVVIAYTDDEPGAEDWITQSVELTRALLEADGRLVRDALVVTPTRFWSVVDADRFEYPVTDIAESAAKLGFAGIDQKVNELEPVPPMDPGQRTELSKLMRDPDRIDWEDYALDSAFWLGVGTGTPLDLARVGVALQDVRYRDAFLAVLALGRPLVADDLARFSMGGWDEAPPASRLTESVKALRQIAEVTDSPVIATSALTVAAWLTWAKGEGTKAAKLIEQALAEDSENTYAQLLNSFFALGVVPDWAIAATNRNAEETRREQQAQG
jgi:hypothetical protein